MSIFTITPDSPSYPALAVKLGLTPDEHGGDIQLYIGRYDRDKPNFYPLQGELNLKRQKPRLVRAVKREFEVSLTEAVDAVNALGITTARVSYGILIRYKDEDWFEF